MPEASVMPVSRFKSTPQAHPSWTAAHPVDEVVHVNVPFSAPCRHILAINRVGQVVQGCFGRLRQPCPPQEVDHVLPGEWSWDEAEQWLAQRGIDALLKPARPRP